MIEFIRRLYRRAMCQHVSVRTTVTLTKGCIKKSGVCRACDKQVSPRVSLSEGYKHSQLVRSRNFSHDQFEILIDD